jgi:hypothetical protein
MLEMKTNKIPAIPTAERAHPTGGYGPAIMGIPIEVKKKQKKSKTVNAKLLLKEVPSASVFFPRRRNQSSWGKNRI